jgi:hypothetical protein
LTTEPGIFSFTKRGILVPDTELEAQIEIERNTGADGVVSVKYRTIPEPSSNPQKHPNSIENTIKFEDGEVRELTLYLDLSQIPKIPSPSKQDSN